ncbi:phosphonate ABC transporter permease [Limnohabitans sp. 2KL-17]|uniref:putative 2-aminoethylphosphonate ABC transporter permease subunit n=1 Tax=Limnohabitans sp. 2KL-17 TaxID=1100704 RepID=UPI000D3B083D|nr:putative 2-aminoethylphosphonate ABC transporter permease subunit [Limnohabitans sp. 2KL-17]PUE48284.1 phosphonate ABC transporter permease [Limnohabitans sp. 2KL-17]
MTPALPQVTQKTHWSEWVGFAGLAFVLLLLLAFLAAPLLAILQQALQNDQGQFVGLKNFLGYLETPSLLHSLWNSIWVSLLVTFIVVPLAFVFAYALTRSCMLGKSLFRAISLIPLLAPSLLSAISLIYWFGNQGVLKDVMHALGIDQIYGPAGVVMAECFAVFPHVLMILVTALTLADARLYEAANALGTSTQRKFFTITLPGAKYGLISASLVSFTLVMTDFGIPKVIGGNFNMMATDIFKLVIGQQDFSKGSVVALLLLSPAVLSFAVDRYVSARQTAMLSARAVAYQPKPHARHDATMLVYCCVIAFLMLAMLGMAVYASFASFWPYDLSPSLRHYKLGLVDGEVGEGFINSLKMASGTAFFGTLLVFITAYLLEKTKGMDAIRAPLQLLAVIPMAVPGLVLGLGYIFFFNMPNNPLHGMYQSMALLTLCTIVHFYTTGHLTATTALKALDSEFESVSASLKVPFYKTFWRVTLPICTPAMVDIARYFFINAMTTISAVVFLYSPETKVASIAILNLDEAGDMGAAAAMAVLIGLISAAATVLFAWLGWFVEKRTQAWRGR